MKRKIRLTESELTRIIRRVISEQTTKQVTVTIDCTANTLDTMAMTQPMITKYCATPKGTTTGAGTTPLDTYVSNMVDWRSSVINDKLAAFGGSKVGVSGSENNKTVDTVTVEMKNPKEDPKMQNLIATPTYYCRYTNGLNAGTVQQYQLYFKYGSPEYNAFVAAAKLQCQASQKKIQEVKFTKQ